MDHRSGGFWPSGLPPVPSRLTAPALCERRSDIPELAEHFVRQLAEKHGTAPLAVMPEVMGVFLGHDRPGNIRELRNVIESLLLTAPGADLTLRDPPAGLPSFGSIPLGLTTIELAERDALPTMIRNCRGNLTAVARHAGLAKSSVYAKMK